MLWMVATILNRGRLGPIASQQVEQKLRWPASRQQTIPMWKTWRRWVNQRLCWLVEVDCND